MTRNFTSERSEAYIALGANLGRREETLREALRLLNEHTEIEVLRASDVYETDPVGYADQPAFLNMAAAVATSLKPQALLGVLQEIENRLGRVRDIRFGPRTADLDLLWMDGLAISTEELTLPHPRMHERFFVLVPLDDIVPQSEPSGLRALIDDSLIELGAASGIRAFSGPLFP
ncbi:2-amino-4-hydroxy-6-hydroxymethyldihydropteridine diphosphokinase [Saccharibacillus sp. CPCC 101409]|uniref:2-amino-4-hydroxy-6- hydroxymethyldihydropteridine diphosphokinase n=1 Tax=Saccharibacillus sp. CPCC 101409 TaxID=3058041 RepID=UPI0026721603|nr:2-amino-4-hydroxy-6-hydroxymethyldihydropteridine diphosphokinase [Saccharibacillus sp. CPCC 101409]MDO3412879.1 2-amino-4-hydroxy-6-hydroxymethyldihydropteridine diphosphokinase [Saccharibacillus sp. CPCC 101409]